MICTLTVRPKLDSYSHLTKYVYLFPFYFLTQLKLFLTLPDQKGTVSKKERNIYQNS